MTGKTQESVRERGQTEETDMPSQKKQSQKKYKIVITGRHIRAPESVADRIGQNGFPWCGINDMRRNNCGGRRMLHQIIQEEPRNESKNQNIASQNAGG